MTFLYVDIMWAMVLLGVTLWTTCCVVLNAGLRALRYMGLALSYAVGAWMAIDLPWREALVTWGVFAAGGGAVTLAYELWARRRYRGTGRAPRPLILLRGVVLWPAMLPDAVAGMFVDAGILPPSRRDDGRPDELAAVPAAVSARWAQRMLDG